MMNSNEFLKHVKGCGRDWTTTEKDWLMFNINGVQEIEHLKHELGVEEEFEYLHPFMLPDDFSRILDDVKVFRQKVLSKRITEKKESLKESNISERDYTIMMHNYTRQQAKKLKLNMDTMFTYPKGRIAVR